MKKKIYVASLVFAVFTILCILFQVPIGGIIVVFLIAFGKLFGCGYAWANYIIYFCAIPAGWIFMAGNCKCSLKFLPAALMYLVGTILIGYLFIDMNKFLKDGIDFCLAHPAPFPFLNTTPFVRKWTDLSDMYIASCAWWCIILPGLAYYLLYLLNLFLKEKTNL